MTSAEAVTLPKMTAEEFMDWDDGGHQGKLELVYGEVRAMSPASGTHALLQATLAALIRNHLKSGKSSCRVGTEAPVQPQLDAAHNVRAPDLAVTCLPPTGNEKLFPDPVLIVEILSPGNEKETWEAITACATIATLREVLVVDSVRIRARVYTKDDGGAWPDEPGTVEAGGTVVLKTIDAELSIDDIYADTVLIAGRTT